MQPRASLRDQLVGAVALLVGGVVFTTTVVSTIWMTIAGELYQGRELAATMFVASCGAVVCAVGWSAHRRHARGGESAATLLARVGIWLVLAGMLGGVVFGFWYGHMELNGLRGHDRYVCEHLSGPLEPSDLEACRRVARECRRSELPPAPLPRGMSGPKPPEGLDLPIDANTRAEVQCVYERRDEFLK